MTARGHGFVTRNIAVGPPAAEFVKDTKLIESCGGADPFIKREPIAIVPITISTVTPTARNRLVVLAMLGLLIWNFIMPRLGPCKQSVFTNGSEQAR